MNVRVLTGDARDVLRTLPDASCHMACTSPPYYGLRDYGVPGQMGLEATPEEWVQGMVGVFREVRRVLRADGTLWLNIGDSYAGSGKGQPGVNGFQSPASEVKYPGLEADFHNVYHGTTDYKARPRWPKWPDIKPKDLIGIPWMLAFALRADGWYLRADIIWAKPNPMPESIQGSRWERHQVTLEERESLSRLRSGIRAYTNGTSDVPGVSQREVPTDKGSLHPEREGPSDRAGEGESSGSPRAAASVLSFSAGSKEQEEVQPEHERTSERSEESGELPIPNEGSRRPDNGNAVAGDSGSAQVSVLLLPQAEDAADSRSRDPAEQGWSELGGEHRASLPLVQLSEEGQADFPGLVECPGCPKCEKNDGYVLRMSAGRTTKSHEYIFLLSKGPSYYYDSVAIREPNVSQEQYEHTQRYAKVYDNHTNGAAVNGQPGNVNNVGIHSRPGQPGRNRRSVWEIATQSFSGAHFATYPTSLIEPCIKAGTSEKGCCPECGAPWVRVVEREPGFQAARQYEDGLRGRRTGAALDADYRGVGYTRSETVGWRASCAHAGDPVPATVCDPFFGAGTTGLVADRLNRDCIGIEINPQYAEMARRRISGDNPMFTEVEVA